MPFYTYKCKKCGHEDSEVRTIEERNNDKTCDLLVPELEGSENLIECNGQMVLKIGNPAFKIS